jgi:hypothetical protein
VRNERAKPASENLNASWRCKWRDSTQYQYFGGRVRGDDWNEPVETAQNPPIGVDAANNLKR